MIRLFCQLCVCALITFAFPFEIWSQTAYAVWDGTTLKFEYDWANTRDPNNMPPHTWIIPEEVGEMPGWLNEAKNAESVEFTSSFADARPKRCFDWFFGFEYLEDITGMQYLNTSETVDMQGMFYGCKNLQSIDLRNFETGSVTMMNLMFGDCSSLTTLDLSSFYTWSVNSMHGMFSGCSNLSNIKFGNNFNTNGVEDMSSMFSGCSSLKRLDISWFRTNSLKYLRYMFSGCNSLEIIDLNNFTTPAAQDMNNMFSGCSSLKRLDLHGFNLSHVSSTREMFKNCNHLEKIICDDDWSGVSESTDMFTGCTSLIGTIPYNSAKATAAYANKTTGYFSPFYYYIAEISNDYNTLTFRRSETAPNNTTQWDATRSGFEDDIWDPNQRDDDYYQPKYTFHGLGKKVVFDESFKDARPNSCYSWFDYNTSLTEIVGIENLNTSEATSMANMFYNCSKLKTIDLRNFDVTFVNNMMSMFNGCSSLETIVCDNDWYNDQIIDYNMFTGCTKLKGARTYTYSDRGLEYANPTTGYFTHSDPVTVTATSYTIAYGDALPEYGYTSEGTTLNGTPSISCSATTTSPVGTYPITIAKGSVTNYNDTYVNGTLTITKAALTVAAKNYTIKQGEALPSFEATYTGFKNSETSSVLTTQPTFSCSATSASAPGTYDIEVSGGTATNYSFTYTKGTLTITDADPVTVTAKSYTITYGDAMPEYEYTSKGATLNGSPSISCSATTTSPVGTYPITISKGSVTNYNDTYVNGTLTINKAALTVAANNYTIKQGDPLPTFEATVTGFKNSETSSVLTTQPTFTCSATSASAPGTYDIEVSGGAATNYSFTYTKGTLTITDADPVTVTAKSYTITYGNALPEYEYTSKGATLNGTPSISCSATTTSPVGTYPITISKGSVTNYNDTYVNGTLTITKAPLTIKAGTYTRKRGKDNPEFTLTYQGFKNNETKDVLSTQPSVTTNATENSPIGTYAVIVSGAEASNYEITHVNGTLIVERVMGDANGDGDLTEADVNAIVLHIMGQTPNGFDEKAANVNGDNEINAADIVALINLIKNL